MAYKPQYYPGTSSVGVNRRKHMSGDLDKLRDIPDSDIVTIMGHRSPGADYPSTHPPLVEMGEPDCPIRQLVVPTPGAAAGDRIRYSQFADSMYNAPATPYWRSYWAAINCRGCDPGTLSGRQFIEARERDIEEYTKVLMETEMYDPALSSMRGCTVHGHSIRLEENGMMFDMLARCELGRDGNVYYVKDQLGIPLDKTINVGKPMNEEEAKSRTTIFRSDSVSLGGRVYGYSLGGKVYGSSLGGLPYGKSNIKPDWWVYRDKFNGKKIFTTTYQEGANQVFCFYCRKCGAIIETIDAFNVHPTEPCCPRGHRNDDLKPITDKNRCRDESIRLIHHIWERRSKWGFRPEE